MQLAPYDPALDLVLERHVDMPPQVIWDAWTKPELLVRWFTPAPWVTTDAEVDLRPGGVFRTEMRGPDGQEGGGGSGCYLVAEAPHHLVWTSGVGPGLRPNKVPDGGFVFTVDLTFAPSGGGTDYRARVMHATAEDCATHAAMGFAEGWGAALDQLVALMRSR